MVKLKSIFGAEKAKTKLIVNFRATEEEKKIICKLAEKYTAGNVTLFIRKALLEVMPSLDEEDSKKLKR